MEIEIRFSFILLEKTNLQAVLLYNNILNIIIS